MVEVIEPGNRISGAQGNEGHLFITDDLGHIVLVGSLEHKVHPEGFSGTQNILCPADVVPYLIHRESAGSDDPGTACMGHGGCQDSIGNIGHGTLDDGVVNRKKFRKFCLPGHRYCLLS